MVWYNTYLIMTYYDLRWRRTGADMRKNRITVGLFTGALILAALWIGVQEWRQLRWEEPLFSLIVESAGEEERICCWQSGEGDYYVFLPGPDALRHARFQPKSGVTISLDGAALSQDEMLDDIVWNFPYSMEAVEDNRKIYASVTFLCSENVPSLFLDTASGSMDHIHREKGNEEPGAMRLYQADGILDYQGDLKRINGRGNATWLMSEKKPYSLELMSPGNLLGMGEATEWILLANAFDASNLRNKIVLDYTACVSSVFTPESRWVNLYLNGAYAGLYLLCERIEVGETRVNIPEQGSFLVSSDLDWRLIEGGRRFFTTEYGFSMRIHHAGMDEQELENLLNTAERAIRAPDGVDPVSGKSWQTLLDGDSWARKLLLEEIFGNLDGGFVSQYFYLDGADPEGKIVAGPAWDYDITMGNPVNGAISGPNQLFALRTAFYYFDEAAWFHYLYQQEEFAQLVRRLYAREFRPLLDDVFGQKVDGYIEYISTAAKLNEIRWKHELTETYSESVEALRDYMSRRIAFLDSFWINQDPYFMVEAMGFESAMCFAVKPGQTLPALYVEVSDPQWYRMDTDTLFDVTQPIYEDVQIYLGDYS